MHDFFFHVLFEFEGLTFGTIHLLLIILMGVVGFVLLKIAKKSLRKKELASKTIRTFDGKQVPIWKLTRQLIWLVIIIADYQLLKIHNPDLKFSRILNYQFFEYDNFHIAIYHIFLIFVMFSGIRIILNFMKVFLSRTAKNNENVDEGTKYVYLQLTKYILISVCIILFLKSLGVNLNVFFTSMAFLLVAIGLGLQDLFKDFFSGLLLLFDGRIRVGDVIEIDRFDGTDNFVARIDQINVRTSQVTTREGKKLIVPNSHLASQKVHNWRDEDTYSRFFISVSVKFGTDLDLVSKILEEAAKKHPMVSNQHDVFARLRNFGNNGLELDLVFWAKNTLYIEIHKSDIRYGIDRKFRENNIQYPFPQMDIHFDNNKNNNSQPTSNSNA